MSSHIGELNGVSLENDRLHLSRLEKDIPQEAKDFSSSLYDLLPRVKRNDLLMEVAH